MVHLCKRLIYDAVTMPYDIRNIDMISSPLGVKTTICLFYSVMCYYFTAILVSVYGYGRCDDEIDIFGKRVS